jgi:ketosteroid isomerase-like protein
MSDGAGRHQLLREVYDAANRGDFDALLACFALDIVWVTPTRRMRGHNAIAGWLIGWHASAAPHHEPERFIDSGERTVALVSISYRDEREDTHPAHVFSFRDDLVSRLEIHPRREEALADLGISL